MVAGAAAGVSLTPPQDITVGVARATYTVTLRDSQDNLTAAARNQTVYLFASGTSGTFYDALTGGGTIDRVTIPSGATSATFYFTATTAATYTVTASDNTSPADPDLGLKDA